MKTKILIVAMLLLASMIMIGCIDEETGAPKVVVNTPTEKPTMDCSYLYDGRIDHKIIGECADDYYTQVYMSVMKTRYKHLNILCNVSNESVGYEDYLDLYTRYSKMFNNNKEYYYNVDFTSSELYEINSLLYDLESFKGSEEKLIDNNFTNNNVKYRVSYIEQNLNTEFYKPLLYFHEYESDLNNLHYNLITDTSNMIDSINCLKIGDIYNAMKYKEKIKDVNDIPRSVDRGRILSIRENTLRDIEKLKSENKQTK